MPSGGSVQGLQPAHSCSLLSCTQQAGDEMKADQVFSDAQRRDFCCLSVRPNEAVAGMTSSWTERHCTFTHSCWCAPTTGSCCSTVSAHSSTRHQAAVCSTHPPRCACRSRVLNVIRQLRAQQLPVQATSHLAHNYATQENAILGRRHPRW